MTQTGLPSTFDVDFFRWLKSREDEAMVSFFGADLKRACLIGVIFTVVHIGTGFGLMWMTRT